jgi:protein-S-isoprenylcysteine O-methyltransferase Ste14
MDNHAAFGLWTLFLIASAMLVAIVLALTRPAGERDWKGVSAFLAFIAALCAEIALVPLLVYLAWRWLFQRVAGIHAFGDGLDLLQLVFGWEMHRHSVWLDRLGDLVIVGGVVVLAAAWKGLLDARRARTFASTGVYAHVQHPLYLGFVLIMFGFLLQWPALLTGLAFGAALLAYRRLAGDEEQAMAARYGAEWVRYRQRTPRFVPFLRRIAPG